MSAIVKPASPSLLRRLGYAGFGFFLIKGLLWLAAPLVFIAFG